jgi:ABC-type multidrug transport system fused ATPase/permease subunit
LDKREGPILIRNLFSRSLKVLPRRDLGKIFIVVAIQVSLSILDLLGVALIGILGALTVNGVQSRNPSGTISNILEYIGISQMSFQHQSAILGSAAALVLVTRTVFSILTTRRILHFLSSRGAAISSNLISKLLAQPITSINSRTSQETLYALTSGVMNITLGVIGNTVTLISDLSLLIVLFVGLMVVDTTVAIGTLTLFTSIALILYKVLHKKAQNLGESQALVTVESNERIVEIVQGFREAAVKNRKAYYANEISKLRFALSRDLAESSFLPYIGKYVIETTVILGALAISAFQFAISDAAQAVATLSIFLAAGTRIAPAVLRMQQSGIQLKSALGSAGPTLDLILELGPETSIKQYVEEVPEFNYPNFTAEIELRNASYTYPGSENQALANVDLFIDKGEFAAVVGASGAGKSTLADLILGLLKPSSGEVYISGLSPQDAIEKWSGAIAYVPQDVLIVNGTFRDNIALGYPKESISDAQVQRALEISQLNEFVSNLPEGLDSIVGERGAKLSGGQRQRLGIARAIYTNPKMLVLDEATSALDGKTEADLSSAINNLKKEVTVVMIAHRLSTVRDADKILYLDCGRVLALGTFEEIRSKIPEFDHQAKLMGL